MWVSFGTFAFDPDSGELRRDGRRVALQRQPARMLAALVAQPGAVVTREALQRAIWGADTHVDFERGLNFCAAQIRSALRDSAASPRFLETVPRQGYRFIAALRGVPEAGSPGLDPRSGHDVVEGIAGGATDPAATRGGARARCRPWPAFSVGKAIGAAALLATLVLVGVWLARRAAPAAPSLRVAVVPFDNETGVPELDRAAKGISDATVVRLTTPERLSRFGVIGNAAALRLTFVPRDLQAMGQALGAQYIVLGQLKRDARGVRVVAHLIRAGDQTHVWAQAFDRETLDLDAQLDVAEAIAQAVSGRVGGP